MKTKKVEIEIPAGKKTVEVNEKSQDVTERIKTFEDACRELGESHQFVKEWQTCGQNLSPDLKAYFQLRIITTALNEGWEPKFIREEDRWHIWYRLITKQEYDKLSSQEKHRAVGRGGSLPNVYRCIVYDVAGRVCSTFGSRFAFKSAKLAEYAGRQFAEIYADFCFKPKK